MGKLKYDWDFRYSMDVSGAQVTNLFGDQKPLQIIVLRTNLETKAVRGM